MNRKLSNCKGKLEARISAIAIFVSKLSINFKA
jgi:hypothetical protein